MKTKSDFRQNLEMGFALALGAFMGAAAVRAVQGLLASQKAVPVPQSLLTPPPPAGP